MEGVDYLSDERKKAMFDVEAMKVAWVVADIIRTMLGPRSMLKMLLDAQEVIVVTNDGNAILRELDVAHPAAKSMIELSLTQDEEFGDGTTSVIVLAGEMLHVAEAFIDKKYHPIVICQAYNKALEYVLAVLDKISMSIDVNDLFVGCSRAGRALYEAEGKDDNNSYVDLDDSKSSIPARSTGFADSFTSADGR
ncbi:hypothetical protein L6452_14944 [Arctium lappa]|uniref:Uncharacterized protein n=1 Tax=Arctium lappa TaxID=4217 RepID=A0ACB9CMZ6_ARCLA|nr:hypothetical protein L6452_14944 [Arctium lappa]